MNISFLLCVLGRASVLNVLRCPPSCGMWRDVSDAESNLMWLFQTQAKGPKSGFWHKQKCKGSQIKARAETVEAYGGLWHSAEINLLRAFCCSWQRHVRAPWEILQLVLPAKTSTAFNCLDCPWNVLPRYCRLAALLILCWTQHLLNKPNTTTNDNSEQEHSSQPASHGEHRAKSANLLPILVTQPWKEKILDKRLKSTKIRRHQI